MEFTTAAREDWAPEDDETITFPHDETDVTFYRPTSAQLAILAATSVQGNDSEAAGTYIALFFEMMDSDSQRYFRGRLFDRNDPFDLDGPGGVQEIMEALVEHWSARPTKQPSDYQPPRSSTGKSSTARTRAKASTSSASRRVASSQ
jgi:hypothetical protein